MLDVSPLARAVRVLAVGVIVASILFAVPAAASPTSPLCDDGSWQRAHPLICDTGGPFPTLGGRGGGGPDGGLLGTIGRILGGLTGGLL